METPGLAGNQGPLDGVREGPRKPWMGGIGEKDGSGGTPGGGRVEGGQAKGGGIREAAGWGWREGRLEKGRDAVEGGQGETQGSGAR